MSKPIWALQKKIRRFRKKARPLQPNQNAGMRRFEDAVIDYHLDLSNLYNLEDYEPLPPRRSHWRCPVLPPWLRTLLGAWILSTMIFRAVLPYLSLEKGVQRLHLWLV